MTDIYKQNLAWLPELDDIKKEIDSNPNIPQKTKDFLGSIHSQASYRKLSQGQIDAAKSAYDRILHPPKIIEFDDERKKLFLEIIEIIITIQGWGATEFIYSIKDRITAEERLSEKQFEALKKSIHRFRKSILRNIFTGSHKK